MLGLAVRRSDPALRVAGLTWAVSLPVFFVSGLPGLVLQPLSGAAFTAAAVVVVRRLQASAPVPALQRAG